MKKFHPIIVILLLTLADVFLLVWADSFPKNPISSFVSTVVPGKCLILEERYCSMGSAIMNTGGFVGIGFQLPAGTPLFSPYSGELRYSITYLKQSAKKAPLKAVNVFNGNNKGNFLATDHVLMALFDTAMTKNNYFVKKGEVIGKLVGKNIDDIGSYNLVVYFASPSLKKSLAPDLTYTLKFFHL